MPKFDYEARTPWEAKEEFAPYFESILKGHKSATIVANGIGAFFPCTSCKTYAREGLFYLPYRKYVKFDPKHDIAGKLSTKFGEKLSHRYLCYVREHPTLWTAPTHILYGENDDLTSFKTICEFANQIGATLTVIKNGEHRFSTAEQMRFLDD